MNYCVIGLGNPGEKYKNTRHNVGQDMLEYLAKEEHFSDWDKKRYPDALVSTGVLQERDVQLVIPLTYMNNSGEALAHCRNISGENPANIIVVHDEIDIPIGTFKLSRNRGEGGHNGVASVIQHLKTKDFIRIRIGIAPVTLFGNIKKPRQTDTFVLGTLSGREQEKIQGLYPAILTTIKRVVADGYEKAVSSMGTL